MLLSIILLGISIINPDGSIERHNSHYESHYNSDSRGGYYFHDNEGNRGHLTKNNNGYTFRQKNNSGPIVINPQKNKR